MDSSTLELIECGDGKEAGNRTSSRQKAERGAQGSSADRKGINTVLEDGPETLCEADLGQWL